MSILQNHRSGIELRKHINLIYKELFRKAIHLCTLGVLVGLHYLYWQTLFALSAVLFLYIFSEIARMNGISIPLVSQITVAASRKRDENSFVLGPVTLALGVIITAVFFNEKSAMVGICALALGDGIASLVGKLWGRIHIPFTNGKTVAGSLSCFGAVFISTACITHDVAIALYIATIATVIELVPLTDADNLLIPVVLAGFSQYVFFIS